MTVDVEVNGFMKDGVPVHGTLSIGGLDIKGDAIAPCVPVVKQTMSGILLPGHTLREIVHHSAAETAKAHEDVLRRE